MLPELEINDALAKGYDLLESGILIINQDFSIIFMNDWIKRRLPVDIRDVTEFMGLYQHHQSSKRIVRIKKGFKYGMIQYVSSVFIPWIIPLPDHKIADKLMRQRGVFKPVLVKQADQKHGVLGMLISIEDISNQVLQVENLNKVIHARKTAEKALQESEEKYRSMMESTKDEVYICSSDFRIEYMNTAMINRLGYSAEGEVCYEAIYERRDKCSWCAHDKVMQGEHVTFERLDPKNKRYYSFINSPIYHTDGTISRLTIYHDMTETRQIQKQLEHAQKMEAVGTLASGIAHEFNNLLFIISGNAEILASDAKPPDMENLSIIHDSTRRGAELVQRLMAFSRQDEDRMVTMDLNIEVKRIRKMLERIIPPMITLQLNLSQDLDVVNLDQNQMEQVLINLCVNARDAMPDGGKLIITTSNSVIDAAFHTEHPNIETGQCVILSVSDTGSGMDTNILEHVFEPFFTTKDVGKGTGLGMSMVYGIIQSHDGVILCDSEPGEGTTFSIYLPVAKQEQICKNKENLMTIPGNGQETILVVDDEEVIIRMVRRLLGGMGYTIISASTGESALDIYRRKSNEIDLILLDLGMPGMGGQRFLERLMETDPDVKVIIASGYLKTDLVQEALKAGAKQALAKPYCRDDILQVIRKVLDGDDSND